MVPSSFVAFFFFAKIHLRIIRLAASSFPLPFPLSSLTAPHDDAKASYHASHTVTDKSVLKLNWRNVTRIYLDSISIAPRLIMNV